MPFFAVYSQATVIPVPEINTYSLHSETNEIGDHTVNGRPLAPRSAKGICVICEFVLKEIDEQIKDKHNDVRYYNKAMGM